MTRSRLRTGEITSPEFAEDIRSCLEGAEPMLVSQLVARLRHGDLPSKRRWQDVRIAAVEAALTVQGACLRFRMHGSGVAVYVALKPFSEVETRHGPRPVKPYGGSL
jgi:hypothetical protein